ncbi:MAG TPA: 2Fe-2S iron-sulfur cluster-binding protein, partial [Solirubrobacteraceae bacterium]|nr:2Fe-2S iron-sulfur cluster-binding protein [Solirubrobacteraceae bacterium]
MARVRFEPLGESIEVQAQETVLDAAFRSGYSLAHGCREGQCSACKCLLLEGTADLDRYSNYALSDTERANGYTLMCRARPESDLVIELLHYDPDNYRLENAIREIEATVTGVRELTHDIVGLELAVPEDFAWQPGQYVDVAVPGAEGVRRSFSIASLPDSHTIELMVKRYPGGRFSSMIGDAIRPADSPPAGSPPAGSSPAGHSTAGSPPADSLPLGNENETQTHSYSSLRLTGPYGNFHLRASERPILMVAGGSGMAPVLGVLRQLAAEGCPRPIRFYYGAREERDLFAQDEIAALAEQLPDFRFIPVTGRFVHEAIDEELTDPDVYMCGPPPMLDAVQALAISRGVDASRIFQDRFTTSADAPAEAAAGAGPAAVSEREFGWFTPAARRATLYEDVTVDTQPSIHRHLTRGWPVSFADGRGIWNDASTALRSRDWFDFRDPGQQWERTFYQQGTAAEQQIESALRSAGEQGLLDDYKPEWIAYLRESLQVPAYVEHGLWFALATAARDCLSDTVATCVCLQAAHKQRSAQAIVLYAMDLERELGFDFSITAAREQFMSDPAWQPTRRYLERLAATADWGEVLIAANLCFEPTVGTLIRRELGTRAAARHGDTVTPVLARVATQEWEWSRRWSSALTSFLISDPEHGRRNRAVIDGWLADWLPSAQAAAAAIDPAAQDTAAYADEVLRGALVIAESARPSS